MESSSPMGIIGSSANSTSCSRVTNNAFSIGKSHNGLVSKKVVRIPFFWLLLMAIVVHALETEKTEEWLQCPIRKVWFHSNCFFDWKWTMELNTSNILLVPHSSEADLGLLPHPRWSAIITTIITKHSIFDVAASLDAPLQFSKWFF